MFKAVAHEALRVLDVPKDLPDGSREPEEATAEPITDDLAIADLGDSGPHVDGGSRRRRRVRRRCRRQVRSAGPKVPNFQRKTMRAVVEEASAMGLPVLLDGSGVARAQMPPAGSVLHAGRAGQGAVRAMSPGWSGVRGAPQMNLGEVLAGVRLETAARRRSLRRSPDRQVWNTIPGGSARGTCSSPFRAARADGRSFAADAVERGAMAVVSESPRSRESFRGNWIEVEHGRQALALAARNFYGKPDERIALDRHHGHQRQDHHRVPGGCHPARGRARPRP